MYDINQIRDLFPITQTHAYLNNPAIGPLSRTAHAAAVAFLDERMHSPWPDPAPSGLLRLRDRKNRVRTKFAQLYGAHPHEVGLVESTSAGENMVAQALLQPGDTVVVDDLHFESSFLLYRQLEASRGITLRIVPSRDGVVDIEDLAAAIDARTKLVSV
jgi:selenocysteine lyase/cysteine desulfurase